MKDIKVELKLTKDKFQQTGSPRSQLFNSKMFHSKDKTKNLEGESKIYQISIVD